MIDPAAIPQIAGDMGALTRHGGDLSQVGTAFADTGARVHTGWQALAGSYLAPEAEQLFAATGPVQGTSASVGEDLRSAGSALMSYAGEVTGIQTRLRTLQAEAFEFVAFATANPDWLSNQADVDRHDHLLAAVDAQVLAFQDAERRCANAILALYSDRRLVADNGDGVLEAHEHGLTAGGLAALAAEGGRPWGAAEALDRGFLGDVGDFFTGVGQGVGDLGDVGGRVLGGLGEAGHGALVGLGMLVGYADGEFDGDTALTAWAGLNALAANFTPLGAVNQFVDLPLMPRGMAQETLLNTVGALTAYDVWGQDPARAAGLVAGNVLLAVLGPKGVGVGLRGGGAAAARSGVPVVARAGEGLVRAGEALGRLPSITEVVGKLSARLRGLDVPPVALPHADLPPTHVDAPRAEPVPTRPEGPTTDDPIGRGADAGPPRANASEPATAPGPTHEAPGDDPIPDGTGTGTDERAAVEQPGPDAPEPLPEAGDGARSVESGPVRDELIAQVQASGGRINQDAVVRIGTDPNGRVVWLEEGGINPRSGRSAGLQHVLTEHGAQFEAAGVARADIPELVHRAATEGRYTGYRQGDRSIFEVEFQGQRHHVAVTVGPNGFIVGANLRSPVDPFQGARVDPRFVDEPNLRGWEK